MKTRIFVCVMLLTASTFSIRMNAQLEVQTSGDVKASKSLEVHDNINVIGRIAIGTTINNDIALNVYKMGPTNSTPTYGIKSIVKMPSFPVYTLYGIYGEANALNATGVPYPYPLVGVYGTFKKAEGISTFAAGVAGIAHYRGGIGVYGGINAPISSLPADAKYAGYFKGTTKVDGTLQANLITINGDTISVNKIQNLPRDASSSLTQLRPVSYTFKPDTTWRYDEKMQREMEGMHYGLIAQEVQKIFPELVYEREGNLSINYIEMIPLLIQAVQELSAEVEKLKAR